MKKRAYLVREEESIPCPCEGRRSLLYPRRREPTLSVKKRAYLVRAKRVGAYLVREEEKPTLSVKKRAYLVREEESIPCPCEESRSLPCL